MIIKIYHNKLFLNPEYFIQFKQTNLPYEGLDFKSEKEIYWKVEVVKFNEPENHLNIRIQDYNPFDISGFMNQTFEVKIVDMYFIGKFDWTKLEPLLFGFTMKKIESQLFNHDLKVDSIFRNRPPMVDEFTLAPQTFEDNLTDNYNIKFTESKFIDGYVTFKKYVSRIREHIEFQIPNEHILKEFDNIKYWFSKKLKTTRFEVKTSLTLIGNKVSEVKATSSKIDLISPELINSIKYSQTIALIKLSPKNNKSLFTAEEMFGQIDNNEIEGNVFNQSDQEILNILTQNHKVRNQKELSYLSGKLQSVNHPLRFTLKPNFGFVFLIEGVKNNHFVWELLNSNATYIWTFDISNRDVTSQYNKIEDVVNKVKTIGREQYKNEFKKCTENNDLTFKVINHKDINSNKVNNFNWWKSKIDEILI